MYASEHNCTPGVVVLAASFGGLAAVRTVLAGLPAMFSFPIVVVVHRVPSTQNRLADILRSHSPLPVDSATDGMPLVPGRVAVLPAGARGGLRCDGTVVVRPGSRLSADTVLFDAARLYGRGVVAVILTGKLEDGAAGVRAVKRHGGVALAQDPADCAAPGMPSAALSTGCVDHRLPLHTIAAALVAIAMAPGGADLLRVPPAPWASLDPEPSAP